MNFICILLGHNEEKIEDHKIEKNTIVTDNIRAKQFTYPVMIHRYRCKRCGKIRSSNPDIIGSDGGKYVVHYI